MLAIVSEATGQYNYDKDGNPLPDGAPATRRYAADNYEFYFQDSWRMTDKLTVTGGVRYSLASPPWEVNGLQVAPTENLGLRFEQRRQMGLDGIPENTLSPIQFGLAGPANNKPGYYSWDKNNFSPRVSAAWTPTPKWVIRGGYSLVYDRLGLALAQNFDSVGSYGLSTAIDSPYGGNNEDNPDVRFQGIDVLPNTVPAAPPGGFPQTPPDSAAIYSTIDPTITTPYAHTFNVVVGRELTTNFTLEAAYIGRLGRNLLMRRDLLMPLDLVDQKSGTDYYAASKAAHPAARAERLQRHGGLADRLLREPVPGRRRRRDDGHAGHGRLLRLLLSRLHVGALRRGPVLRSCVHDLRAAIRTSTPSSRRSPRRAASPARSTTRCSSRSASATATATSSTSTTPTACRRTTAPRSSAGPATRPTRTAGTRAS